MATIDSRTVNLKDGREVVLRCAREDDAAVLLEFARTVFLDGEGMILEPEEFIKTEEEQKAWIRALNDNPRQLLLIADAGGVIVGNVDFHIGKRRRLAHSGSFGMSVRSGWRGFGVGNVLLKSLVEWARSVPEIEKITLGVRADNPRAIALYKKHGFVQSGCSRDAIKMGDGSFVDDLWMEMFVRS